MTPGKMPGAIKSMKNSPNKFRQIILSFKGKTSESKREQGSAIIVALLVMVLLLGFVAFAVTRTTNDTIATSNDVAESRAYEASQASLEVMTRNFDKIFDTKLNPDEADQTRIVGQYPPGFETKYNFVQQIFKTQKTQQVMSTSEDFQGLSALRDEWQINSTATDKVNGAQVALRRRFFNDRIPIFQFGIFYNDDLEFHPGPRFDFGGRVHSNDNLFMMAQDGLYFSSKVSYVGEVYTDVARNGQPWTNWNENVFIKNASGTDVQLKHDMGSVLTSPVNGAPVKKSSDQPTAYKNANWTTNLNLFQGNLLKLKGELNLPLRIASKFDGNENELDYIELIKRGKSVGDVYNNNTGTVTAPAIVPVTAAVADGDITSTERYYNKTGMRVSIADKKQYLPGCATATGTPVTTACGVCLTGKSNGTSADPDGDGSRGYQPKTMADGYQATRLNGERFYAAAREIWIKIEAVGVNPATNIYEVPRDITEEILSLGVTQPPIFIDNKFEVNGYGTSSVDGRSACTNNPSAKDCRSIVKLQRFIFGGSRVTPTETIYSSAETISGTDYNFVEAARQVTSTSSVVAVDSGGFGNFGGDHTSHRKEAIIVRNPTAFKRWVVPFPINMFDAREGLYNTDINTATTYPNGSLPWNGVMSSVDIDVGNLRKFLTDKSYDLLFTNVAPLTRFNTQFNRAFKSTDVPSANGWVLYISDRRGDADFDGEYDMEDIYGNNDCTLQPGEDVNSRGPGAAVMGTGNALLDAAGLCPAGNSGTGEAPRYTKDGLAASPLWNSYVAPEIAAFIEHKFYRRGVRLINAQTLPGIYDAATAANTKGFTVASENGVYVLGNYNAYSIDSVGTPTASNAYNPQDTSDHIPASIAADAITILSNSWSDSQSFSSPFVLSKASETFDRFAILAGDAKSSQNATPNQGGGDTRLGGGVHNFKRFLEDWGGIRLNYVGSLINLYNSHNNNGAFKCCGTVYNPPIRNWVFDATFLDPDRLPPGTPFFQEIQLTGFQRLN